MVELSRPPITDVSTETAFRLEGTFWFAVLCGQRTLLAMDCATVEKSTSGTGLAHRLLVKLGLWKVSWMRFWRTCYGFSSSLT